MGRKTYIVPCRYLYLLEASAHSPALHFNEILSSGSSEDDISVESRNQENQSDPESSQDEDSVTQEREARGLESVFRKLLFKLDRVRAEYTLSMASRLYGEKSFPISQEYLDKVMKFYHTTMEAVDFQKSLEETIQQINFWVECQSQGKIKELFTKDTLNSTVVMVLVNAVYFRAKWEKGFETEKTEESVFWLSQGEQKKVKMMHQRNLYRIGFIEELKTQILEMRYIKGRMSMFVLLPSSSAEDSPDLEEVERQITQEKLSAWTSPSSMAEAQVDVSFPQFTLQGSYDLNSVLQDMGITDLFDESKSDLSGISPQPHLYLSQVVHKTFVEVTEVGTEAAAASGVAVSEKSAVLPVTFNADHPFLFFIRHNRTQTILFYGRVCSP
uniref:Serpin family B member 12 n=1 Tax=Ornithorhynchus anatinus TaxID=9258 RepID=A0A6I8P933_ORNAN